MRLRLDSLMLVCGCTDVGYSNAGVRTGWVGGWVGAFVRHVLVHKRTMLVKMGMKLVMAHLLVRVCYSGNSLLFLVFCYFVNTICSCTHTHTHIHTHTHTGKTLACVRLDPAGDALTASVSADPSLPDSDYVTCPVDRLGHYM